MKSNSSKTTVPAWLPHGKAIKSYWQGNLEASIGIQMENEPIDFMPASIYFRKEEEMPELEVFALSLCTGKILDIGAGAGAHALLLQESNSVTALDISSEAAEVMKARGLKQIHCGDFLKFKSYELFDTLLFLMNGVGIVSNLEGLEKYLIHAYHLTKENGQILLDSSDLSQSGNQTQDVERYFGIVNYQLSFEEIKGEPYDWLYVDPTTLTKVAEEVGWNTQIVFESNDGSYLARLVKK